MKLDLKKVSALAVAGIMSFGIASTTISSVASAAEHKPPKVEQQAKDKKPLPPKEEKKPIPPQDQQHHEDQNHNQNWK